MKKKIIFFDGDGTLWYPSSTKRTQKPHWIYHDDATKDNYLVHMELAPSIRESLLKLKEKNILCVLVSASPYPKEVADKELREKLEFFELLGFFHSYQSSPGDRPEGKGELMLTILDSLKLTKDDALMVGDSYFYDYLAAKNVGIDAFFIENEYAKMPDTMPRDLQTIKEVRDLLDMKSKSFSLAKQYLGKTVDVVIDRPLGSKHPKYGFAYGVNYGYIPDTKAPDGEELDAYVLGIEDAVESFKGICIAIIHRLNDDDDKLIVIPEKLGGMSDEDIRNATNFQEQFFISEIIRS